MRNACMWRNNELQGVFKKPAFLFDWEEICTLFHCLSLSHTHIHTHINVFILFFHFICLFTYLFTFAKNLSKEFVFLKVTRLNLIVLHRCRVYLIVTLLVILHIKFTTFNQQNAQCSSLETYFCIITPNIPTGWFKCCELVIDNVRNEQCIDYTSSMWVCFWFIWM
jgi:hypothetical protein